MHDINWNELLFNFFVSV